MLKQVNDALVLPIVLAAIPNTIMVAIGILINNARLSDLRNHVEACFDAVDRRFDRLDRRFDQVLDAKPERLEEI
jgi:hypothetical protein